MKIPKSLDQLKPIPQPHPLIVDTHSPSPRGGKKSQNPLTHPNSLTNCPTKPTYWLFGGIFVIFMGIFITLEVVKYFGHLYT